MRLCRTALRTLFPYGPCVLCGGDSRGGPAPGVCRSCWGQRKRPAPPLCPVCGSPLPPVEGQPPHACGACLQNPPAYEAHVSAYEYAGPARTLVLLYKDRRRYPVAGLLGTALARRVRSAWPDRDFDAVVYVPSPLRRRIMRGFEPAGLIALAAARRLGAPCRRWLLPAKPASVQKGLSAAQRRRNLAGAFRAPRGLKGLRLLLVDDVRTTGTTLGEAARVLARAGAVVYAATFAFTPRRDLDLYSSKQPDGDSEK